MVNMALVRELANNPNVPTVIIGLAFSFLTIEDRNAILNQLTPDEQISPTWQALEQLMNQQDLQMLNNEAQNLFHDLVEVIDDDGPDIAALAEQGADIAQHIEDAMPNGGLNILPGQDGPEPGPGPGAGEEPDPAPQAAPDPAPDPVLPPDPIPGGEGE